MTPGPPARRHGRRRGDDEARPRSPATSRSTRRSNLRPRSVLGLKYVELTRGKSKETFEDGETLPADQVDVSRSSSTTTTASSTARRATRGAREPQGLRQRARRPRRRALNETIADAAALPRAPRAGRARRSPTSDTQLGALLQGARRRRAGRRARSPTATRTPSRPAPTRSRRGRATPTALRATIRDSAPTMRDRHPLVPRPAAVPARHRRVLRALRDADRGHAGARCRAITRALQTGIPVARAARRRSTPSCSTTLGALEELVARPERTIYALRGVTRLVDILHPLIRFVGPVRHGLQLLQLLVHATSASTSPSPTRPATRSARCSTRPRAPRNPHATRASARSARSTPSNGEPTSSPARR